jgi:hypothetical protein
MLLLPIYIPFHNYILQIYILTVHCAFPDIFLSFPCELSAIFPYLQFAMQTSLGALSVDPGRGEEADTNYKLF